MAVRGSLTALLLAACYGPKAPSGAPCDPAAPVCPRGQTCQPAGVCSSTALPAPDAAVDAPPDAQAVFAYPAAIAKCINPLATPPSPSACAAASPANQLHVDGDDVMHPWDTFLRFDLDTAFAGRTVTGVRLQLTATDVAAAHSDNSGVVYKSVEFTNGDLSTAVPLKAQTTALAPSQGEVTPMQTVEWPLPASLASPGGSIYLELDNPSTDGVDYWDGSGTTPPQLFIDAR
jgi:hypothetical protein